MCPQIKRALKWKALPLITWGLHFTRWSFNWKGKKKRKTTVGSEACVISPLCSPPLSCPWRQVLINGLYYTGEPLAHRGWCCSCQDYSKGRQHRTLEPPLLFLPKQMLFLLKRSQIQLEWEREREHPFFFSCQSEMGKIGCPPGSGPWSPSPDDFCLGFHVGQDESEVLLEALWSVVGLCLQISLLTESTCKGKKKLYVRAALSLSHITVRATD